MLDGSRKSGALPPNPRQGGLSPCTPAGSLRRNGRRASDGGVAARRFDPFFAGQEGLAISVWFRLGRRLVLVGGLRWWLLLALLLL